MITSEDRNRIAGAFVALMIGSVLVLFLSFVVAVQMCWARDDGRYAGSPLKSWFDGLRSGKGPCCSDADGTALSDVDWETKDQHYRVRIEGAWWDVPDDAVLTEPNRFGKTMVWPIYHRNPNLTIEIRCFIPGSMT